MKITKTEDGVFLIDAEQKRYANSTIDGKKQVFEGGESIKIVNTQVAIEFLGVDFTEIKNIEGYGASLIFRRCVNVPACIHATRMLFSNCKLQNISSDWAASHIDIEAGVIENGEVAYLGGHLTLTSCVIDFLEIKNARRKTILIDSAINMRKISITNGGDFTCRQMGKNRDLEFTWNCSYSQYVTLSEVYLTRFEILKAGRDTTFTLANARFAPNAISFHNTTRIRRFSLHSPLGLERIDFGNAVESIVIVDARELAHITIDEAHGEVVIEECPRLMSIEAKKIFGLQVRYCRNVCLVSLDESRQISFLDCPNLRDLKGEFKNERINLSLRHTKIATQNYKNMLLVKLGQNLYAQDSTHSSRLLSISELRCPSLQYKGRFRRKFELFLEKL